MKIFKNIVESVKNLGRSFKDHPYINSLLIGCNIGLIVGSCFLIQSSYGPLDMYDNSTAKVTQVYINNSIKATVKVIHEVQYSGDASGGSGSGTLICGGDGEMFVLTCEHVVNNSPSSYYGSQFISSKTTIEFMRQTLDCTIVFADKETDVALLKVNTDIKSFKYVDRFVEGYGVEAGDVCYAIGFPQGVGPCISQGIISTTTYYFRDWNDNFNNSILSDVTIDHGNSGGGLFVCKDGEFYFAGMSRWGGMISGVYGFADMDTIRSTFTKYAVGYLLD